MFCLNYFPAMLVVIFMMCTNHVLYADDICLLAPSASAMQLLIDVCYDYGSNNDIFAQSY